MFAKISTLVFALPLVSALSVNSISGWNNGATVTVSWSATTNDPGVFSIELVNTAFNNQYAIANNIVTATGQYTFELPQVPVEGGYTVNLIATNNVNQVYASSNSFSIGAPSTSSGTASSTGTSSSTGTQSTPSMTGTSPASSGTSRATGTASGASSSPSNLNSNGAASFKLGSIVPAVALVLPAIAGAVMVF